MRILALPVSVIALLMGCEAKVAILVFVIFETIGSACRVFILAKITDFNPAHFVRDVLVQVLPPTVIALLTCYFIYPLGHGVLWMAAVLIITCAVEVFMVFLMGLTKEEKNFILSLVGGQFNRLFKK